MLAISPDGYLTRCLPQRQPVRYLLLLIGLPTSSLVPLTVTNINTGETINKDKFLAVIAPIIADYEVRPPND